MLRTRHQASGNILLAACLAAKQKFVIDNTNPTAAERAKYIEAAKAHKFTIIGYYFQTNLSAALTRNAARSGKAFVPEKGTRATANRLQIPSLSEGFDALFYVKIGANFGFVVEQWRDEI